MKNKKALIVLVGACVLSSVLYFGTPKSSAFVSKAVGNQEGFEVKGHIKAYIEKTEQ